MKTKEKKMQTVETADGHRGEISIKTNLKLTTPKQYWINIFDKEDGSLIYGTCWGAKPDGILPFLSAWKKEVVTIC